MFQLVLPVAAVFSIDPSPPDIIICLQLFYNRKAELFSKREYYPVLKFQELLALLRVTLIIRKLKIV